MSTKRDVVRATATVTAETHNVVNDILSNAFDIIIDMTKREGVVTIANFGTFRLKETKERDIKSPISGEVVHVPARVRLKFKPASGVLSRLNDGSEAE